MLCSDKDMRSRILLLSKIQTWPCYTCIISQNICICTPINMCGGCYSYIEQPMLSKMNYKTIASPRGAQHNLVNNVYIKAVYTSAPCWAHPFFFWEISSILQQILSWKPQADHEGQWTEIAQYTYFLKEHIILFTTFQKQIKTRYLYDSWSMWSTRWSCRSDYWTWLEIIWALPVQVRILLVTISFTSVRRENLINIGQG